MLDRSELSEFIDTTVRRLQDSYVFGDKRGSAAALAVLRRAVNREPGADPAAWPYTLEGLPSRYTGREDTPTAGERAAHMAMTLYAIHQQSKSAPMHRNGPSLGKAVRLLGAPRGEAAPDTSKAVKRRFDALMTAATFAELVYHARGLVSQLRSADIALDYGRFAEDIRQLQSPATADAVLLRWGRDYNSRPHARSTNTASPTASEGAAQ